MIVVTANWAIADGTIHGGPASAAVRTFFREVRRAAWRAGFRLDGRYEPIDAIQIVFAGDTFDGLTSLAWHGDLRPWQGGPRARATAERVAARAARRGGRLLATLGRLIREGLSVPMADGRGRPLPGTTRKAAVSIVCLVGDRDRILDGHWVTAFAGRYGIAIGTEWSSETVTVRHGSECDPLCGLPGLAPPLALPPHGRSPTLAESLAVDLLVDFAHRLQRAAVTRSSAAAVTWRLAAAPPLEMPLVIARVQDPEIRSAWQRSVRHWHARALETMPEAAVHFDAVDCLAAWMAAGGDQDASAARQSLAAAIEPLRPRLPKGGSDPRLFVLGHPPATIGLPPKSVGGGCLCLGPTATTIGSMPAAVMFPTGWSHRGIWLSSERHAISREPVIHVVPSRGRNDVSGIIDAA